MAHVVDAVHAIEQKGGRAVKIKLISPFLEYLGTSVSSEDNSYDDNINNNYYFNKNDNDNHANNNNINNSDSMSIKITDSLPSSSSTSPNSSPKKNNELSSNPNLFDQNWELAPNYSKNVSPVGEGVLADPLLCRVLYNLLSNAVKFSPLEGEVVLSVSYEILPQISIIPTNESEDECDTNSQFNSTAADYQTYADTYSNCQSDATTLKTDHDRRRSSIISSISMTSSSCNDTSRVNRMLTESLNIDDMNNNSLTLQNNNDNDNDNKQLNLIACSLLTTAAVSESNTRLGSEKTGKLSSLVSKVFNAEENWSLLDMNPRLALGVGVGADVSSTSYNSNNKNNNKNSNDNYNNYSNNNNNNSNKNNNNIRSSRSSTGTGVTDTNTNTNTDVDEFLNGNDDGINDYIAMSTSVPTADNFHHHNIKTNIGYDIDNRLNDTVSNNEINKMNKHTSHIYDGKIGKYVSGNASIRNILRSRKSSINNDNDNDNEDYDDNDNLELKIAAEKLHKIEQNNYKSRIFNNYDNSNYHNNNNNNNHHNNNHHNSNNNHNNDNNNHNDNNNNSKMNEKNKEEKFSVSAFNFDTNNLNINKDTNIDMNDNHSTTHHYNKSLTEEKLFDNSNNFSSTPSGRRDPKTIANFTFHFQNQLAAPLDKRKLQKYFNASNMDFQSIFSEDTDEKSKLKLQFLLAFFFFDFLPFSLSFSYFYFAEITNIVASPSFSLPFSLSPPLIYHFFETLLHFKQLILLSYHLLIIYIILYCIPQILFLIFHVLLFRNFLFP